MQAIKCKKGGQPEEVSESHFLNRFFKIVKSPRYCSYRLGWQQACTASQLTRSTPMRTVPYSRQPFNRMGE
jgi:hypothetical protein